MTTTHKPARMVFFNPAKFVAFDEAVDKGNGYIGLYTGMTLASMLAQGGELISELEASKRIDAAFIKPPKPCTEERFMDMLEVLPPQDWRTLPDSESFKLQERTTGNITLIMVRIGDAYWEMEDMVSLSHQEILSKVENDNVISCLNYQGTQMTMRHIACDFDGRGERDYLIGTSAHSDLLLAAMDSDNEDDSRLAQMLDEQVYFYTDCETLWGDASLLILHLQRETA